MGALILEVLADAVSGVAAGLMAALSVGDFLAAIAVGGSSAGSDALAEEGSDGLRSSFLLFLLFFARFLCFRLSLSSSS
jgi:hypothetical protein